MPLRTTHELRALRRSTPALSDQTELLGRYESPGLTDERYLVRRSDGQTILLTLVLWLIASGLDEHHDLERVAHDISERLGKPVSVTTVAEVIEVKIKPLGILGDQTVVQPERAQAPLLSLAMRGVLVPARAVRPVARVLRPFYWLPVVLGALVGFGVAEWYAFVHHGVGSSFEAITNHPVLVLPTLGLVILGTLIHEFGHATACAYGGGKPGRIGYGIYLVFPCFFANVSDSYRLSRRARLRTDLGGVYFNALFVIIAAGLFSVTGYVPLLPAIVLINFAMVEQLLPFARLDGYFVLSDLVGVVDANAYIKSLADLIPGRKAAHHFDNLRPRARRTIKTWVAITVPLMIGGMGLFVWHLPQLGQDSYRSAQVQWTVADLSYRAHHWATAALAVISLVLLAVPALGLVALLVRLVKRIPVPKKGNHHMKGRTP